MRGSACACGRKGKERNIMETAIYKLHKIRKIRNAFQIFFRGLGIFFKGAALNIFSFDFLTVLIPCTLIPPPSAILPDSGERYLSTQLSNSEDS